MKKVLFCLSLIFGLLVLNQVPSFAMEASFETIGALGDLGYGLIGGATFDFDGTEFTIDDFDNLSEALKQQAAEQKAREFLQAYCMARGIPIPNIDPDLPASTGKEFYKSMYFDSANRTVWNNYKLGRTTIEQQEALRFPISPQSFNDWTGYSDFWYQKYIDNFTSQDEPEPDPDVPSTPTELVPYVNMINLRDATNPASFHFYNAVGAGGDTFALAGTPADYSWFNVGIQGYGNNVTYFSSNTFNTPYMNPVQIKDLYVYSDQSEFYINQSFPSEYLRVMTWGNSYSSIACYTTNYNGLVGIGRSDRPTVNLAYHGTLTEVFDYISKYAKNVNIWVNGDLVASAGVIDDAPANPIIPEFPDVIGGNDDDPIPAYDIVFPDTSDYEGTFDITSLFDALKEAIIGASDNDDSTDSTLTREKVTDTYKDKVGEAVGEAVKTIDDVMEDSFPVQGTLNYPALPPIPQIPLDNAFSGTTILSELIDACQQILPSPLALAFWGMIFILFIIGLIRILHK